MIIIEDQDLLLHQLETVTLMMNILDTWLKEGAPYAPESCPPEFTTAKECILFWIEYCAKTMRTLKDFPGTYLLCPTFYRRTIGVRKRVDDVWLRLLTKRNDILTAEVIP